MKFLYAFLSIMLCAAFAVAQITVTQSSIQNGPTAYTWHMPADVVTVDNGSNGTNQTWSFMQSTVQTQPVEVISPAGTPFAGDFPTANRCLHSGPTGFGDFIYFQLTASALYALGNGSTGADPIVYPSPAYASPLPVTYGTAAWSYVWEMTQEAEGHTITQHDSSRRTVDAWGTVNTPYGSFQVIRSMSHSYSTTIFDGFPINTSEYYSYAYVDVHGNAVVTTASLPGDANPNYTEGTLTLHEYGATNAEPVRGPVANSFSVAQNYPNPFNPTTQIPFQVDKPGIITLRIYNELGELVSEQTQAVSAGMNSLSVDGSNWSTGNYFANISADGQSITKKMQLVK